MREGRRVEPKNRVVVIRKRVVWGIDLNNCNSANDQKESATKRKEKVARRRVVIHRNLLCAYSLMKCCVYPDWELCGRSCAKTRDKCRMNTIEIGKNTAGRPKSLNAPLHA